MKATCLVGGLVFAMTFLTPFVAEAGSFGKGDPHGPVGEWYIGEEPDIPNGNPPVLFVHGYNSSSLTWWEDNNMYDLFREAGYQTSFINLHPDRDMYANGAILADKLTEIYDHFGQEVMVVAHSKGGLDTQTALTHYDAESYVSKVITLSSPHHGSELADLAHSNWASWLTGIIGARSEATESLQTGEMAQFRSVTDPIAENISVPFYTISGNEPGSFGSALYWGGVYLNSFGSNDGSVTVTSSSLSYAEERESGPWNHSEVKTGEFTYPFIEPLMTLQTYSEWSQLNETADVGSIVKGGEVNEGIKEQFLVEEDVDKVSVHLLTNEELSNVTLVSPDGAEYEVTNQYQEDEHSIFEGAWAHPFELHDPVNGQWQLLTSSEKDSLSYLMIIGIEGGVSDEIHISPETMQFHMDQQEINTSDITYTIYSDDELVIKDGDESALQSYSRFNQSHLGKTNETITIDVTGKTKQGDAFERTFIKNIQTQP